MKGSVYFVCAVIRFIYCCTQLMLTLKSMVFIRSLLIFVLRTTSNLQFLQVFSPHFPFLKKKKAENSVELKILASLKKTCVL